MITEFDLNRANWVGASYGVWTSEINGVTLYWNRYNDTYQIGTDHRNVYTRIQILDKLRYIDKHLVEVNVGDCEFNDDFIIEVRNREDAEKLAEALETLGLNIGFTEIKKS